MVDASSLSSPSAMTKTVLVVDDDADFRSAIRQVLELHDYRVLEAADGIEALQTLAEERVEVLVTDLFMLRMDGLELLRRIGDSRRKPGIIAVTGVPIGVDAATRLGADVVLIKPMMAGQLLTAVAEVLVEPVARTGIVNECSD
jgi:CheY-like chemotaxis protein